MTSRLRGHKRRVTIEVKSKVTFYTSRFGVSIGGCSEGARGGVGTMRMRIGVKTAPQIRLVEVWLRDTGKVDKRLRILYSALLSG